MTAPTDRPAVESPPLADVGITPMRRRHLRRVCEIEAAAQSRPWSMGMFEAELGHPDRRYVVAQTPAGRPHLSRHVVGFGGVMLVLDEAHITNIAVEAALRRRGVARRIVLALLEEAVTNAATAATLEVRATNTPAQRLYSQFGFAPVGLRPGYYPDTGEDAIIMWAYDIDGPDAIGRRARIRAALDGAGTTMTIDHTGGR